MGRGSRESLKALQHPVTQVPPSSPTSSLLPPKVLALLLMLFLLPGMTTDLLLTLPGQFKRQLH